LNQSKLVYERSGKRPLLFFDVAVLRPFCDGIGILLCRTAQRIREYGTIIINIQVICAGKADLMCQTAQEKVQSGTNFGTNNSTAHN
jgi:hypothetical protein